MRYPISSLLHSWGALANQHAGSIKKILEIISNVLAENYPNLNSQDLIKALLSREKRGSTGLGHGVAIPHCRIEHCTHPVSVLIKLKQGIDFMGVDDQPVDLIFALIVPKEADKMHLEALKSLVAQLNLENYRNRLRQADSNENLYRAAIQTETAAHNN